MIPEYDDQNIFAKILRQEIPSKVIYENAHALAFNDIMPQAPIHVVVIPKGAYVSFEDFYLNGSAIEIQEFHACIHQVTLNLGISQQKNGNGFRILSNIGRDGGQEIPHFHMHILAGRPLGKIIAD